MQRIAADDECCYIDVVVALRKRRPQMTTHVTPIETLDAAEVARLLNAGKLLLIDVREPSEYASERIPGALLYPLSTFDATALPDDGSRRIVFHCGSGKRSLVAAERRLAAGQVNAAHMGGGIAAWKAAGLPVIADSAFEPRLGER
jgi:rhodanese-related sulfurtransferase